MFSDKEIKLIQQARRNVKQHKLTQAILFIALLIGLTFMLIGYFQADHFAYFAVVVVAIAIAKPQMEKGPSYEALVGLLEQAVAKRESKP